MKHFFTFVFLFYSCLAFSASNRYWVAGSTANWNNTANWATTTGGAGGASVPGTADAVIFDGNGLGSCNIDINASVTSINMSSAYTGTLTQNSGITIATSGAFTISAGIFIGGNSNIDINGTFSLAGGTFTSTSSTLYQSANIVQTSGAFNHNNGTIVFDGTNNINVNANVIINFYNITINMGGNTNYVKVATNDVMAALNDMVLSNGLLNQQNTGASVKAYNNVTVQNTWDGGTCDIEFTGTATTQNFDLTGATALFVGDIKINKASGTVKLVSALTTTGVLYVGSGELNTNTFALRCNGAYNQSGGTLTSGSSSLEFNSNLTFSAGTFNATTNTTYIVGNFTQSGGTFNHNNGTMYFNGSTSATVDAISSITFYNVTVNKGSSSYYLRPASNDTILVSNSLTLINGLLNQANASATVRVYGNTSVQSTWGGGTCDIEFTGSKLVQDFDLTDATALFVGDIKINKSVGKLRLLSSLTTSGLLTLALGELDVSIDTLTCNGAYTQSGGTLTSGAAVLDFNSTVTLNGGILNESSATTYMAGNFTQPGGTFNHNNGTLYFDGSSNTTVDPVSSITFYNVIINKGANNYYLRPASSDVMIVSNNLTLINGLLNEGNAAASTQVSGNVTVQSTFDGGSCDLEFTGTTATQNFDLSGASTLFLGNIKINKSSGTVKLLSDFTDAGTFTLASGTFDMNTHPFTCTGAFSQSGGTFISGAAALDFNTSFTLSGGTFNAPSSTFNLNGAFTHTAGGTFIHNNGTVIFDPTSNVTYNVNNVDNFYNVTFFGNTDTRSITISANDTLRTNGKFTFQNGTYTLGSSAFIDIKGGLDFQSTWDGNAPNVTFSGTGNFTLEGTKIFTGNLTINKISGVVQLANNFELGSSAILTLTNGKLDLNSKKLIIDNSATNAIQRTSGYITSEATDVSAKVLWFINTTTGNHIFPFGDASGNYIPFEFNATAGDFDTVKVATYDSPNNSTLPPTVGFCNGEANVVDRFWQIDKTGASGTATVKFTYTGSESPANGEDDLKAQRWNSSTSNWDPPLTGQTNDASANTVTVTGISSFSPWGIARGSNPLPVELISFDAKCEKNKVNIEWQTASEINNDYFVVEKSTNGMDYTEMYKYDLDDNDANSNVVKLYSVIDYDPYSGTSYYRLKQVDLNGAFELFAPVTVNYSKEGLFELISIFADYDTKTIEITYNNTSDEAVKVLLYNQSGQVIIQKNIEANTGYNTETIIYPTLKDGVYFLELINSKQNLTTKMFLH